MKTRQDILQDKEILVAYNQAITILQNAGILDVLLQRASASSIPPNNGNYTSELIVEYGRSTGYRQCLDDLLFFRERFLEAPQEISVQTPDFLGVASALGKGDITQGELDAIRTNSKPDYTKFIAGL